MQIANAGKYLGIWIGPGSGGKNWVDPLRKLEIRIKEGMGDDCGALTSIISYNTRCLTVLPYQTQVLEERKSPVALSSGSRPAIAKSAL